MDPQKRQQKLKELDELRLRISDIERELSGASPEHWQATDFYTLYYATTGFVLGGLGAIASLIFNIVGSSLAGLAPLRIIQVYLTFPLGEQALSTDFTSGIALAVGCCLYIGTGMVLGVPFQLLLARYFPKASLATRLMVATALGLVIWAINFYGILSWLQPALFGGNWIVDPQYLPPWVAALTHLVFAWTMALIYPWGVYVPYRRQTELA